MRTKEGLGSEPVLTVPDTLLLQADLPLPNLTYEMLDELKRGGWKTVGLMVAFTDSDGNIMLLEHNARDKNEPGVLGPLGETSQYSGPIIEQPIQTLFRGIQEELAVQRPTELDFWIYQSGGWIVNQWPRGKCYTGEFACAISFPVFVPDEIKNYLLAIPHGSEEVCGLDFYSPEAIFSMPEPDLRPGTKKWLEQLDRAGVLTPQEHGILMPVDFSSIYEASLRDVEL